MKARFFSSNRDEAILTIDFAKLLSDQPHPLIGKEVILRYAERRALSKAPGRREPLLDAMMGSGKPPGWHLDRPARNSAHRGVIESDPSAGIGGFGGARVYLPLKNRGATPCRPSRTTASFLSGNSASLLTWQ